LKDKINELESNGKNKIRHLYRGITEFKKGHQPRTNLVKDESGDLLVDSLKILTRREKCFCQLLNVQVWGGGGVRQTEIDTTEPFVPEPSVSEVEVAIGKFKRCKSLGAHQILAEPIQAEGKHCFLRSTKLLS
jgi:hypothetical protein